jgi:hypothetical protein
MDITSATDAALTTKEVPEPETTSDLSELEESSASSQPEGQAEEASTQFTPSSEKETNTVPSWFVTSADFALATNGGMQRSSWSLCFIGLFVLLGEYLYI